MVRGIGENGHKIFLDINKVSNGLTVAKANQVFNLSIFKDSLVDFKNNVFEDISQSIFLSFQSPESE